MVKYQCKVKMLLKVYLEIPLNNNKQRIATSQLLYIEIQFAGFYMIQAFLKGFFCKNFKTAVVLWMPLDYSSEMVYVFYLCMLP